MKKDYLVFIGVVLIIGFSVFAKFYLDAKNKIEILKIERDYYKKSYEETRADAAELLRYIKNKE